jgi:dTDP-4-amino-4,6-dideoxygalactose transaminase
MPPLIPFHKPLVAGKELHYIAQAVSAGRLGSDGLFIRRCSEVLEQRLGIARVLMTPSCNAALEMAALLCDLGPGAAARLAGLIPVCFSD